MYANGIFFSLCIISLRLSVCALFLRITPVPWQRGILYSVAIITTIINTTNLFVENIFCCTPVPYYWNEYLYPDSGSCLSNTLNQNFLYAQYSISIAADWVTSLLPLLVLKNLTMDKKTKFLTCCLLGMGIFASGAGIAAIVVTPTANDSDDYAYSSYPIYVTQIVEPFVGTLAISFATYRPLFKSLGSFKENFSRYGKRGYRPTEELEESRTTDISSFRSEAKLATYSSMHTKGSGGLSPDDFRLGVLPDPV
jgi:hypothetical protein